jgi:hypothetical protein
VLFAPHRSVPACPCSLLHTMQGAADQQSQLVTIKLQLVTIKLMCMHCGSVLREAATAPPSCCAILYCMHACMIASKYACMHNDCLLVRTAYESGSCSRCQFVHSRTVALKAQHLSQPHAMQQQLQACPCVAPIMAWTSVALMLHTPVVKAQYGRVSSPSINDTH